MTTEAPTTEARGNTMTRAFYGRAFQLTINEPEKFEALRDEFLKLKTCDYMIAAKEQAPTTGHEHIHLYVHFNKPYSINKKIQSYKQHIEVCRGTPKQNIDYVKKDGQIIFEFGEQPHQGLKTVKDLKEMTAEEVPPQYYRIKKEIDAHEKDEKNFFDMLEEIENDELKAPKIIYITGGTGKGKTYKAYKIALKNYKKEEVGKLTLKNEFFDVINEKAKCYVIEEFRPSQIKASDFLQLTDKYGYRANIKGGFCSLRPEMIIICSIIPPEKIYKEEVNQQFLRRITEQIDLDRDPDMD